MGFPAYGERRAPQGVEGITPVPQGISLGLLGTCDAWVKQTRPEDLHVSRHRASSAIRAASTGYTFVLRCHLPALLWSLHSTCPLSTLRFGHFSYSYPNKTNPRPEMSPLVPHAGNPLGRGGAAISAWWPRTTREGAGREAVCMTGAAWRRQCQLADSVPPLCLSSSCKRTHVALMSDTLGT